MWLGNKVIQRQKMPRCLFVDVWTTGKWRGHWLPLTGWNDNMDIPQKATHPLWWIICWLAKFTISWHPMIANLEFNGILLREWNWIRYVSVLSLLWGPRLCQLQGHERQFREIHSDCFFLSLSDPMKLHKFEVKFSHPIARDKLWCRRNLPGFKSLITEELWRLMRSSSFVRSFTFGIRWSKQPRPCRILLIMFLYHLPGCLSAVWRHKYCACDTLFTVEKK